MKFLRRNISLHIRIGSKRRRGRQTWRRPKGRDNKIRESKKGRPPLVSIGYGGKKDKVGIPVIYNMKDLENAAKYKEVILGKVGKKKKIEILKKALEMKINIQNVNTKKFLKKNESK